MMIFPFYFLDYKYHDGDNSKDNANDKDYKKSEYSKMIFWKEKL